MRRGPLAALAIPAVLLGTASVVAAGSSAPMCGGHQATIVGTNGPDELFGTDGPDVIVALNGDDFVFGAGGDDIICGGNGADFLSAQQGNDQLWGQNGDDIVIGGPGNDIVHGDNGNDLLFGNFGDDELNGGRGDDFLNGDLPFPPSQDPTAPPGAYEDPNPSTDTCNGGQGVDASTFCESESSIEEHPDPSTVIFE